MFKYETGGYVPGKPIREIEVIRETAAFVFVRLDSGRERKQSKKGYYCIHDTWEQAKAHLIEKEERELAGLLYRVQKCRSRLGTLKSMTQQEAANGKA